MRWSLVPGAPDVQRVLTLLKATGSKIVRYRVRYFDPIGDTSKPEPIIRVRTKIKDAATTVTIT